MTIRKALITGTILLAAVSPAILGLIGTVSISRTVFREAQDRVNHDLDLVFALYDQSLQSTAQQLLARVTALDPANPGETLRETRKDLEFAVLNLCDPEGKPIAGAYPDRSASVPVNEDPILRRALSGRATWGTVLLDPERLRIEGGAALRNLQAVASAGGRAGGGTESALFQWFAVPIADDEGRVIALAYGGRALNHNYALVDSLRSIVFGSDRFKGKPLGTVTVFLDGVRVATNVQDHAGRRAVGTEVSDEVRREVLEGNRRWRARAWVVDSWYLSGYEPLHDPDGRIIGMLYVGLLEEPYNEIRSSLVARFLAPVVLVFALGLIVTSLVVRRITRPLGLLKANAERIRQGDWEEEIPRDKTFSEIADLSDVFRRMQDAIRKRDQWLREQNRSLSQTTEELQRANRNYMKTLGFVTHELKSPLANMQMMIDTLVGGLVGEIPEKARHSLVRIKRNCEELQDMVKNYLDMSRADRGEMTLNKARIDFREEVVLPCIEMSDSMFLSRNVALETDCPDTLPVVADPELMKIALGNFLSNAAKYGREGGKARLEVRVEEERVTVCVWNEGSGFTEEEGKTLFRRFTRLRNDATRGRRGSGLGLYLCKEVLQLHRGEVWAESKEGEWARFCLRFPVG
ncbi:MAG: cache domain-containing protein [Candidatus Eisenbacteria bacterium]|nr:cache domain-containing protein [Candidatus Eisenbacteria bacterium]